MRILLAEDNLVYAHWVSTALEQSCFSIDHAVDGAQADQLLSTEAYDAVVMDVGLPRMDGIEVLRRLRRRDASVPVLLLSGHAGLQSRVRGLDGGADDYVVKPCAVSELEARLRALIRRAHAGGACEIAVGRLTYDTSGRRFRIGGDALPLRPREFALLEALMLRLGRAISRKDLYERVFDLQTEADLSVIDLYIHRLRKRLIHARVRIVTLRGLGHLLQAEGALEAGSAHGPF